MGKSSCRRQTTFMADLLDNTAQKAFSAASIWCVCACVFVCVRECVCVCLIACMRQYTHVEKEWQPEKVGNPHIFENNSTFIFEKNYSIKKRLFRPRKRLFGPRFVLVSATCFWRQNLQWLDSAAINMLRRQVLQHDAECCSPVRQITATLCATPL